MLGWYLPYTPWRSNVFHIIAMKNTLTKLLILEWIITFGLFGVRTVRCSDCSVSGLFGVKTVRCSDCSMFGLFDVRTVRWSDCSVFGLFGVRTVRCSDSFWFIKVIDNAPCHSLLLSESEKPKNLRILFLRPNTTGRDSRTNILDKMNSSLVLDKRGGPTRRSEVECNY